MSADDDTFDIDLYGEDGQDEQQEPIEIYEQQDELGDGVDYGYDGTNDEAHDSNAQTQSGPPQGYDTVATQEPIPQQGKKRKAPSDEDNYDSNNPYVDGFAVQLDARSASKTITPQPDSRSADYGATPALKFGELHWWTTEEDLRAFCARAGVESELRDIQFGEHKINGKGRGDAYMEFVTPQAASAVKREIQDTQQKESEAGGARKTPFTVYFSSVGNPFRTGPSVGNNKKDFSQQSNSRGGAYNSNFSNRGGGGYNRGGFNQNRGGGYNSNMYNNRGNHQGGWGMNNGGNFGQGMGGGFGAGNPMMAGNFGANPMMGGFPNMNRGGMMNMMGRGGAGFGGMGMNRGNMMGMMGRGGWGGGGFQGGMQQGFGGGNFQGGGMQQQPGNKRPKMDG